MKISFYNITVPYVSTLIHFISLSSRSLTRSLSLSLFLDLSYLSLPYLFTSSWHIILCRQDLRPFSYSHTCDDLHSIPNSSLVDNSETGIFRDHMALKDEEVNTEKNGS